MIRLHSMRVSGRARVIGLLVAASLGVTIALQAPLGVLASGPTVTITTHFYPTPVTITVGQTVTWVNKDTSSHWVIAERNTFPTSGPIKPGGSYRVVFREVGTYPYQDEYGNRSGTVIVTAAPPPTPTPKPTARPTPRPTAKPTAKPAATAKPTAKATKAPAATASATTAAVAGSPGQSQPPAAGGTTTGSGSAGPGSTTSGDSPDGGGGFGLGTWLLLVGLVGLAFVGGIWFATSRRASSPAPLVGDVAMASPGLPAGVPPIAAPPPPVLQPSAASDTRHQMPGDVDEDAPIQAARTRDPGADEV